MKKVYQIMGGVLLVVFCCQFSVSGKTEAPEIPIVETKRIVPNPEILLENEVKETRRWDEGCTDDTVQFSYQEAQLLMRVAQAEAGNQGVKGMALVMQVIVNSVNDPEYPNTVEGVVYQKGRFETVTTGKIYEVTLTPEVHQALAEIEKGTYRKEPILGFETKSNGRTLERYFTYLYTVGDHDFYKKKSP